MVTTGPLAALAALCIWALILAQVQAQFKSKRVDNPEIPATSFSCVGRHNGYYADVEADCQVYHMCLDRQQFSYQCPNTTRFQQRMMVCDHWYQVDCPSAPLAYSANLLIGQRDQPFVGDDEHRAIHEAAVRTSKGLLKGLSQQPAANALDNDAGRQKQSFAFPAPSPKPSPRPSPRPSVRPPTPSPALQAPFEDDEPKRGGFFQRSPSSSFAQPFQNQIQQQQQQQPSSTSSPGPSFTFTPPPTPAPPRFSISFSPSPSFPASGHNLQRPPVPSPSAPIPSALAPVPTPFASSTFAPSAPPAPPAPTLSAFAPSATAPSAFAPSAPTPSSFAPSAFAPSAPTPSSFAPSAFAPSAPQVRTPSRELEAPVVDFPEPDGNALLTAPASAPSPTPFFSPQEAMTAQQTSSFASPFARPAAAPPSRELTPPHFFGSDVSAPGLEPRPFSLNTTQRFSLFAATASPGSAPAATLQPPSRELEVPLDDGESEADFNTVELRYRDTRRLFFIPTADASGPSGPSGTGQGDASDATDPVVVIKYPSKSTRGLSTAHVKSYPADVKRRVDPACPHCHPDFVVPGTCRPCVLLR